MKLAKILLAGSLVASCAFAEGAFVGIEGGYSFKNKVESEYYEADDKSGFVGIKGGYDFGNYRAFAQYNYNTEASVKDNIDLSEFGAGISMDGESKWTSHELLLEVDFTPRLSDSGLKFVVGPYFGLGVIKVKEEGEITNGTLSESYSESTTATGFVLGGRVGMAYDFGTGEFEAGVKADKAWYKDVDANKYGAYLGYNFKF